MESYSFLKLGSFNNKESDQKNKKEHKVVQISTAGRKKFKRMKKIVR